MLKNNERSKRFLLQVYKYEFIINGQIIFTKEISNEPLEQFCILFYLHTNKLKYRANSRKVHLSLCITIN